MDSHNLVPVEALRAGDPFTDVHAGGEYYRVLEAKQLGEGCVVLELESHTHGEGRVIEKSFPADYIVGRAARHSL